MIDFKHSMAAHCESGTLTNLLNHKGLEISETLKTSSVSPDFALTYFQFMLDNRAE